MLRQITPRLGRFNIVSNSFGSCIANTPKEFSWTPEMSFSEMISQPRMLSENHKSTISLKQLQSSTDTHCSWHFNKQVNMVNSNSQLINFESMFISSFSDKKFNVHPNQSEFHWVSGILGLPDKMESILSKGMFKTFQIHFFAPRLAQENTAHANFFSLVHGDSINPLDINRNQELNIEDGNSSLCLKAEVSLPLM